MDEKYQNLMEEIQILKNRENSVKGEEKEITASNQNSLPTEHD
jgi:hypothetical protein